jgi:hypothetical protein
MHEDGAARGLVRGLSGVEHTHLLHRELEFAHPVGRLQQVVEIGAAVGVAQQVGVHAVEHDAFHLHLLGEQGPPGDVEPRVLHRGELEAAVALAQAELAGLQAQPREPGDVDVAFEHQVALLVGLDVVDDLRLEVVGVEQVEGQAHDAADQHEHQHQAAQRVAPVLLG